MNTRPTRHVLALALLLVMHGCSSDSTGPGGGGASPFSGAWTVQGVVVSKATCTRDVGDTIDWDVLIAADGGHGVISLGGAPRELVITGTTARANWDEESNIDVELRLTGNTLSGTLTATARPGLGDPCTEVFALSGTRSEEPLSADFHGDWDLVTEVRTSSCSAEPIGTTEEVCRRITVDGNALAIEDLDGTIVGVGSGTRAIVIAATAEEVLTGRLDVSGGYLAGSLTVLDLASECTLGLSVTGNARDGACPPPADPDSFAGAWHVGVFGFLQTGCTVPDVGWYIGACLDVTVDGSDVTVDDGTGRGLLYGTVAENAVVVSRAEPDGTYQMRLELVEGLLGGEAAKIFTSGECSGSEFTIQFEGPRLPDPCASAGGVFAGNWNLVLRDVVDGCQLPIASICSSLYQNGNVVIDADNGFRGEVTGSRLTVHDEEVIAEFDQVWTLDMVLDHADGSLSGTFSLTIRGIANPQDTCTISAGIQGTARAEPCPQDMKTGAAGLRALLQR